jgi:hypothetical protein
MVSNHGLLGYEPNTITTAPLRSCRRAELGGWGGRSRAHLHTKMYLLLSVDVVSQSMGMLALLSGLGYVKSLCASPGISRRIWPDLCD